MDWISLNDEDLLKVRICDLKLQIENSPIFPWIQQFSEELAAKEVKIQPKVYLGDEWFSPEGMLAISVPFFLAHPRLQKLEQNQLLEVEGGTHDWFLRLIRHEAGHCFDHAYRFSKRHKWRKIFGSPEEEYSPETYHPKPYSKSYVQHLDNWYAQAHPDEDFAETFAVWMTPNKDWRKDYKHWPAALQKLEYIEELVQESKTMKMSHDKGRLPYAAENSKKTLLQFYRKRKKDLEGDYPGFWDEDLRRIFNGDPWLGKKDFGAARFLKKHKKEILDSVSYWTGENKFPIEQVIKKFTLRCEVLDLKVGRTHEDTLLQLSAYLATLVTNYLFTGKFKRTV